MAETGFAGRRATAMIPAKDVERAKRWYEEKLGIAPKSAEDYGAAYEIGGLRVYLYASDYAGSAKHTLISFESGDVEADVKALRAKGVKILDYDLPGFKTVDGIATFGPVKNAWCEDSEGNILGFVSGMG
jgi:predicted enzyme related to lactoylglutathione lyase